MSRTANGIYTESGEDFEVATADNDPFDAGDVQKLAAAVKTHNHDNDGKGNPAQSLHASQTAGDIFYATSANAMGRLAKGSALQKLRMNAGATAPEWAADSTTIAGLPNIPAGAFELPATNFPQPLKYTGLTNWPAARVLAFDQTTEEACYAPAIQVPAGFTACTINVFSLQPAATSGTLGWKITSKTFAEGEDMNAAGTTDTATAETVPASAEMLQIVTKALTVTGWAAGELLLLKVARDTANDTVAEDAYLLGVALVWS